MFIIVVWIELCGSRDSILICISIKFCFIKCVFSAIFTPVLVTAFCVKPKDASSRLKALPFSGLDQAHLLQRSHRVAPIISVEVGSRELVSEKLGGL